VFLFISNQSDLSLARQRMLATTSLPRAVGNKVKTDRLDALGLAKHLALWRKNRKTFKDWMPILLGSSGETVLLQGDRYPYGFISGMRDRRLFTLCHSSSILGVSRFGSQRGFKWTKRKKRRDNQRREHTPEDITHRGGKRSHKREPLWYIKSPTSR